MDEPLEPGLPLAVRGRAGLVVLRLRGRDPISMLPYRGPRYRLLELAAVRPRREPITAQPEAIEPIPWFEAVPAVMAHRVTIEAW